MFRRAGREAAGQRGGTGALSEPCPKCGFTEVVGDTCPRCRVKVSSYRIHLAALSEGGIPGAVTPRRRWRWKRLFTVTSFRQETAAGRLLSYENLIQKRIYRELRYPKSVQGMYIVLLGFEVSAVGRAGRLRVAVYPPNPDVGESVRAAVNRAQPFPSPPLSGRSKGQRVSFALTVTI